MSLVSNLCPWKMKNYLISLESRNQFAIPQQWIMSGGLMHHSAEYLPPSKHVLWPSTGDILGVNRIHQQIPNNDFMVD